MRALGIIALVIPLLYSCWPSSVSFVDKGSMPEEWETFYVKTLESTAPNAPMSYPANLSEEIKDGIQSSTRLSLDSSPDTSEVIIEGTITGYSVAPIALQDGDNAAQNKLTVTVMFDIFINKPEEDKMSLSSSRFVTFDSSNDLATVEATLLSEINDQIVQDVINKLLSNW